MKKPRINIQDKEKKSDGFFDNFERAGENVAKTAKKIRDGIIEDILKIAFGYITVNEISSISTKFRKKFNGMTNKSISLYDNEVKKVLRSGEASYLTKREIGRILETRSVLIEDMKVVGQRMKRDIKSSLISIITSEKSIPKTIKKINSIYPGFAGTSETVLNTYLQRTYRDISFENQKAAGYPFYKYSGPKDRNNRPYCAEHVRKTYTAKKSQGIQDTMNGFYNCRHHLIGRETP
jgi:hypothetical protein